MHHTQFSAFMPIRDTPMENMRATPRLREHRLYQADHLLEVATGFAAEEIVYDTTGNLPLAQDPKIAWALSRPELFPVEIRRASYHELLRVPGIGPLSARRIVNERRSTIIRGLADLRKFGVLTTRAAGFLSIGGHKLRAERWSEQLGLWALEDDVGVRHSIHEFSPGTFR